MIPNDDKPYYQLYAHAIVHALLAEAEGTASSGGAIYICMCMYMYAYI